MDKETKIAIGREVLTKTKITKEQYEVFKGLAEDLDLTMNQPESRDWDSVFEKAGIDTTK